MPPMNGSFDATTIAPEQGVGKHPVGKKFPAVIKGTSIEETQNKDGGYFQILFETPAGQIFLNYNLWNKNAQAVEISQKQLSALCHATGIFKLDWSNEGAVMRGAQCMIDVDPDPKEPEKYSRVSKVYDKNGNEPGKQPVNAPQPQQGQPQGQPQGQWGQQPAQQPQPNGGNGGWGAQGVGTNPNPTPNTGWSQQQPGPNGDKPAWATNK